MKASATLLAGLALGLCACEAPQEKTGQSVAAAPADTGEGAYIAQHLALYDFRADVQESRLEGPIPGVTFKLKNNGNRTLSRVKVRVIFKDGRGQPIAEDEFTPVLYLPDNPGTHDNGGPLRPGYVWQMEAGKFWAPKSVPSEWQPGAAEARISEIQFADGA